MTAAHRLAGISFIDRNIYIYQHATARQGEARGLEPNGRDAQRLGA
jgi:hypothetical protein